MFRTKDVEENEKHTGFELFTAVVMKSPIFWDISACSPFKVDRRFGGIFRLHLEGRRKSKERNQHKAGGKQSNPLVESPVYTGKWRES
jgi:hypothetical protein